MHRRALSVPAQRALLDGLLAGGDVLDFGCGRGGDVRRLVGAGVAARGWDPHYRPDPPPAPATAVLCSYVLNVVADPAERAETLRRAWMLAQDVLIVAVRTDREAAKVSGDAAGDGLVTSRGTFQALLPAAGLADWIGGVLGCRPVPAGTGLMYVFRSDAARAGYLANRFARRDKPAGTAGHDDGAADVLAAVAGWLAERGRPPVPEEDPGVCRAAEQAFGGTARAAAAAHPLLEPGTVAAAARRAADDLLVFLALDAFHGRTRAADLPPSAAADARTFFGSYAAARAKSDRLLAFLARRDLMAKAARASRVGKLTPTALYVHADAVRLLSAPLRAYAECAELVAARPPATNLLKLHHDRAAVSFLTYPTFDRDPHPQLDSALLVDLAARSAAWTDYASRSNRPLLHRKEEFVGPDHPRAQAWRRLTASEARAGLYRDPSEIGTADGWQRVLDAAGVRLRGHRLVRVG
jgi:DNA phosphorothioation-associated putative methyltransferase